MFPHPVVTVARDPGSGGNPIAKKVADKLGYEFYDDALIEAIARSAKRRSGVIKKVDEKARGLIQDLVHTILNPEYISQETYVRHLTRAVLSIAHQGRAVFLGRGINFILPPESSLNVLITAPKGTRVKRAVKFENHTAAQAREIIDKVSKDRRDFVATYFKKGYHNPKYYDLIINTSYLDIDDAADLIVQSVKHKFRGRPHKR